MKSFEQRILSERGEVLQAREINVLQVNVGYRCNQACKHCHVAAGPARHEQMDRETVDGVLAALRKHHLECLDITGGAPELNPNFKYMVRGARETGAHVIVRTNLTVFFEAGMADLPEFFRDNAVEVTASLPCYTQANVDEVRGEKAFEKSMEGLGRLNDLGYGKGNGLNLNLVYNPLSAFLPGAQDKLEQAYREQLQEEFGIVFDRLLVFANMPIGRFRESLMNTDGLLQYMETAKRAFNEGAIERVMCRHLLSVGWDGTLYDCDFNQALGLPVGSDYPRHITDFDLHSLESRLITTGDHCFVCAAGQGFS